MNRRWVTWTFVSMAAFAAFTVFAHTPQGLRAFAWLSGKDGCPLGHDQTKAPMTVADIEHRRIDRATRERTGFVRAAQPATSRPALGFALDADRRGDVLAWTQRNSLSCTPNRAGSGLRCDHVDGAMLPSPIAGIRGVVSFGFDVEDRLISVAFQSASTTPKDRVLEVAATARSQLEQLGATTTGTALRRETRATFTDYAASVVATSVGTRWMTMQTFQSIPNG
jgi:hypothetical protein